MVTLHLKAMKTFSTISQTHVTTHTHLHGQNRDRDVQTHKHIQ